MDNSPPYRRPSLFWPLILIGLGALLLLQNFGLLPAGLWPALLELWPVLIILIGLDMLVGRRSAAGTAIVIVVGALIVAGALLYASLRAQSLPEGRSQSVIQTQREAKSAEVEIRFDVGELRLGALGPSDMLMEGRAVHGPGESLRQAYSVDEGLGRLELEQRRQSLAAPFLRRAPEASLWELNFSPDLPLRFDIETGVGENILDLSGLRLIGLELQTGVGQTQVFFPEQGAIQAAVRAGVGDVTLTLPIGLPARLTINSGLAGVNVSDRFRRDGNTYTTEGFSTAGDYLELDLSAGVGQVTVR